MIIDFETGKPTNITTENKIDPKKKIHICSICGKEGNWNDSWRWYGSYKDAEDGKPIEKYCSRECALKSGNPGYDD